MQYAQRVDVSALTVLAVCTCGWRDFADDRLHAREQIRDHILAVHPGPSRASENARRALNKLRKDSA